MRLSIRSALPLAAAAAMFSWSGCGQGAADVQQQPSASESLASKPVETADTNPSAESTENTTQRDMLIDPKTLHERLGDERLRILDARAAQQYAAGHIPGAVHVDVAAWQKLGLSPGGLHEAEAWGKKVGGLGISHDTQVVVYGESLPSVGRIWWTLKYLGVEQVAILDGGWRLWQVEKLPTVAEPVQVAAVPFRPKFQPDRLEETDSLKRRHRDDGVIVLDVRTRGEYTGEDVRAARGGRIPGSTHLEWTELIAEDGRFKSRDELRALFERHGVLPDKTAITC